MFALNFKTVEDIFTNFGTSISLHQMVCKKARTISSAAFLMEFMPLCIFKFGNEVPVLSSCPLYNMKTAKAFA